MMKIFFTTLLLLSFSAASMACEPMLINGDTLEGILAKNLKKSKLNNPKVSINPDSECPIELQAEGRFLIKFTVVACTRPIHKDTEIGLDDIQIKQPISRTLDKSYSDISEEIVGHCGELKTIKSTSTTAKGILLTFNES